MPPPDEPITLPPVPAPALLLDASGDGTFAGILGANGRWISRHNSENNPLEALFPLAGAVLGEAAIRPDQIAAFIYCSGPGSVLGIRLCGMAIETWRHLGEAARPLFRYSSLRLTAELLVRGDAAGRDALLVSEWKQDAWNAVPITAGVAGEETIIDDDALAANRRTLYHLPRRKGWRTAPANAIRVDYEPGRLPEIMERPGLLHRSDTLILPDSGANTFQKWIPERHR